MQWRHRSKGPKTSWECNLAKVLGDQWRAAALDRKSWRANCINSVGDDLLGHGSQLFGVKKATEARCPKPPTPPSLINQFVEGSFGALAVERGVAQAALQQQRAGIHVQFVGDSKNLN